MKSKSEAFRSGTPLAETLWLTAVLMVTMVLLAGPTTLVAQEHGATDEQHDVAGDVHEDSAEHEESAEEHEGGEHGEEHGEGHHFHKHHFAVIISATEAVEDHDEEHNGNGHDNGHSETHSGGSSDFKDDPDFTIGFDYERRFTQLLGFGGMLDWIAEGRREFLLGPIGFLHPFGGSKFWVAPLAERVRATGDWNLVVRIGAGWDIPIGKSGKYSIAPNINYDISDEHKLWVVGVAIGRGF